MKHFQWKLTGLTPRYIAFFFKWAAGVLPRRFIKCKESKKDHLLENPALLLSRKTFRSAQLEHSLEISAWYPGRVLILEWVTYAREKATSIFQSTFITH